MYNQLKFVNLNMELYKHLASGYYSIRVVSNDLNLGIAKNLYFALSHICAMAFFLGRSHIDPTQHGLFASETSIFILETACFMHKKYRNEIVSDSTYITRSSYYISLPIPSCSLTELTYFF